MRARGFAQIMAGGTLVLGAAMAMAEAAPSAPTPGDEVRAAATAAQIRTAVGRAAQKAKLSGLRVDGRLERAAQELARRGSAGGAAGSDGIFDALWRAGVAEPGARLLLTGFGTEQPEAMLAGLPQQLAVLLRSGRWNRFGVGVVQTGPDESRAAIVVLESAVELAPLPADGPLVVPLGAPPLTLTARVRAGYRKPQVMVTEPGGQVSELAVAAAGSEARFELRCKGAGAYKVELLAQDARGPTVLANFPWYCGQSPPPPPVAAAAAGVGQAPSSGSPALPAEPAFRDVRDAEAQLLLLLNADRQRAGLPPLQIEPRLVEVARAHSADMQAHRFVAHVSPRTGSPSDRVKRAGIRARLLAENLAQAASPRAVEQSLMDSPGHRANILNPSVTRVGIGAVAFDGDDGQRQLLVTQVFIEPLP